MTYRPRDWSPLATHDPVPGDPDEVERHAVEFRQTAQRIGEQSRTLRALSRAEGWDSEAGRVFAEEAGELAQDLAKAHGRYATVSTQLGRWADALRDAQCQADQALRDAQDAEAARRANSTSLLDGVDDPDPFLESAERRRKSALADAGAAINAARRRLDNAVDSLDAAAANVAGAIADAADDDLKDGFWDRVKGFVKDHAHLIRAIGDIVGWVATAVSLIALVLAAPLAIWVVALTAVAVAIKVVLAAAGEGSWGSALLEAAQFGPARFGGKLAKGARAAIAVTRGSAARFKYASAVAGVVNDHRVSLGVAHYITRRRIPLVRGAAARHIARVHRTAEHAGSEAARAVLRTPLQRPALRTRLLHLDAELAQYTEHAKALGRLYGDSPEVLANVRRVQDAVMKGRVNAGAGYALDVASKVDIFRDAQPRHFVASTRCRD